MKHILTAFAAVAVIAACTQAEAQVVGKAAPGFKLTDANGKAVSLSDYKGKTVVLEWNNPECPFVKKHYGSSNMQNTQAAAAKDGIVWLTINSGAPGNQGHMNGSQAKSFVAKAGARPAAYLLDPTGAVGRSYGAKTTPHMYVVNKAGTLVYAGGIDDKPTANPADIKGARNHVLAALSEIKAGKAVSVPTSKPYGCSVKYADG